MQDAVSTESGSETSTAVCYANLPVETWCAVWALLPSIKDIFSASQVCVGWRSIALANRQLWSRPNVHFPRGYDLFRHCREELPPLIAAENVAARPMLCMLDTCLDRAGARIEMAIQVDHAKCHIDIVTRLQAIISRRPQALVSLVITMYCEEAMLNITRSLPVMPNLRHLTLKLLQCSYSPDLTDLAPLSRFPALESLAISPHEFNVPVPKLRGTFPKLRELSCVGESTSSQSLAARAWPHVNRMRLRIGYEDRREKPSPRGVGIIRKRLERLGSLEIVFYWGAFERGYGLIPVSPRPRTLLIGMHVPFPPGNNDGFSVAADVCKAVNIALDLSPAPISLTLEPCEYATIQSDFGVQYRDPVLITAHDPATLRTRQVGIHPQALYRHPSVWAAVGSGIGISPILDLIIPWDCMDAFVKQLQPANIGSVERLTIRVTSDAGTLEMWRAKSLAPPSDWPVFPALRHLTVMQDSDMYLLDPTLVRDAIQKLVPLPRRLDTLSLHHVSTALWPGWSGPNSWHSLLDAAAKVYGISS